MTFIDAVHNCGILLPTHEVAMRSPLAWVRIAGVVQVAIIAANFVLPKKLRCRENLASVSPIIREIFVVHWVYIVFVLGIFASLCFWFAPELAGASPLGRFLAAVMAVFWLLRLPVQLFFYDRETRRQNRLADAVFIAAVSYLGIVFTAAALKVLR
ncbi:MAG: hypothetical protein WBC04_19870 [Candidatus Acidiferrales bacterium]